MKYGIIVCPKCKKTKIADLSYKITRCTRCNEIIDIKKLEILYKSNSAQQARQAIGQINLKLGKTE